MDFSHISKVLIYSGIILVFIGSVMFFLNKIGINSWKLPGDIVIQKENCTFYFPLATSLLISLVLTIILSLLARK